MTQRFIAKPITAALTSTTLMLSLAVAAQTPLHADLTQGKITTSHAAMARYTSPTKRMTEYLFEGVEYKTILA